MKTRNRTKRKMKSKNNNEKTYGRIKAKKKLQREIDGLIMLRGSLMKLSRFSVGMAKKKLYTECVVFSPHIYRIVYAAKKNLP